MTGEKTTDRQRIARLWRDYIWPQKGRLFLAVIFMVLFAAATAGYVYLIQLIIDATGALDSDGEAIANAKRYAAIILPVILTSLTNNYKINLFHLVLIQYQHLKVNLISLMHQLFYHYDQLYQLVFYIF